MQKRLCLSIISFIITSFLFAQNKIDTLNIKVELIPTKYENIVRCRVSNYDTIPIRVSSPVGSPNRMILYDSSHIEIIANSVNVYRIPPNSNEIKPNEIKEWQYDINRILQLGRITEAGIYSLIWQVGCMNDFTREPIVIRSLPFEINKNYTGYYLDNVRMAISLEDENTLCLEIENHSHQDFLISELGKNGTRIIIKLDSGEELVWFTNAFREKWFTLYQNEAKVWTLPVNELYKSYPQLREENSFEVIFFVQSIKQTTTHRVFDREFKSLPLRIQ